MEPDSTGIQSSAAVQDSVGIQQSAGFQDFAGIHDSPVSRHSHDLSGSVGGPDRNASFESVENPLPTSLRENSQENNPYNAKQSKSDHLNVKRLQTTDKTHKNKTFDVKTAFHGRTLLKGKSIPARRIPLDPLYLERPIKPSGQPETKPRDPRPSIYRKSREFYCARVRLLPCYFIGSPEATNEIANTEGADQNASCEGATQNTSYEATSQNAWSNEGANEKASLVDQSEKRMDVSREKEQRPG